MGHRQNHKPNTKPRLGHKLKHRPTLKLRTKPILMHKFSIQPSHQFMLRLSLSSPQHQYPHLPMELEDNHSLHTLSLNQMLLLVDFSAQLPQVSHLASVLELRTPVGL